MNLNDSCGNLLDSVGLDKSQLTPSRVGVTLAKSRKGRQGRWIDTNNTIGLCLELYLLTFIFNKNNK